MAGGGWVDIKKKNTHLKEEEGRAEDTVGICVIRRSVSLVATGQWCWTAAEVMGKKQSSLVRVLISGCSGITKTNYLIFSS